MSKFLTAVAVAASLAIATVAAATTADARRVVHTGVPVPPGVAPGGVPMDSTSLTISAGTTPDIIISIRSTRAFIGRFRSIIATTRRDLISAAGGTGFSCADRRDSLTDLLKPALGSALAAFFTWRGTAAGD